MMWMEATRKSSDSSSVESVTTSNPKRNENHLVLLWFTRCGSFFHPRMLSRRHTLSQNNLCEFWRGMQRTCKNTNNKIDTKNEIIVNYIYIYIYIYIINYNYIKTYNHSRHWPYKTTAIKYMSPPAASYMRPGAGLYIYMYNCIYIYIYI